MSRLEVTFVISHLGAGGAQRVISLVANEWARRGKRVEVVTLTDTYADVHHLDPRVERTTIVRRRKPVESGASKYGVLPDIPARSMLSRAFAVVLRPAKKFASLAAYIAMLFRIRRKLTRDKPKVVFAFIAPTNILTILASQGLGIRIIISERNDPTRQSFGAVWDFLRRCCYRRAHLVTANSKGALLALREYVPADRLTLLPNPLQVNSHRSIDRAATSKMLAVGRLETQKGYEDLLGAFARIHENHPDWRLMIAGDGSQRNSLQRLARDLKIDSWVDWLGQVDDTSQLYERSNIYILCSRYEGTPNALLEAMSNSIPPIVMDNLEGALEFVEHDVTGLVVSAGRQDRLAEAIERLICDPRLRRLLGRAAWQRVQCCALQQIMPIWDKALLP